IFPNITAGLDTSLDNPLNFLPPFLDFLHAGTQTADRVAEKFVGLCKNDEAHLHPLEIPWSRDNCRSSQPLLHRGKAGRSVAGNKEFDILLGVKAEMSEDHPRYDIGRRPEALYAYDFTLKLLH